jgi:hypothetical protein
MSGKSSDAIYDCFSRGHIEDSDTDNVVDAINSLAGSAKRIAVAIDGDSAPGTDACGGHVGCATEALMGVTAGLVKIANAIHDLAEAVRESNE